MIGRGIDADPEAIRAFCRKWKIRELCLFGSALREDFRSDSDVDFLADFDDDEEWDVFDEIHMGEELARIVGRPVDLLSRYAVEHDSNALFRRSVLSTLERVYAA